MLCLLLQLQEEIKEKMKSKRVVNPIPDNDENSLDMVPVETIEELPQLRPIRNTKRGRATTRRRSTLSKCH